MSFDETRVSSRPSPAASPSPATGTLNIERGPDKQLVGTTYPLRGPTVQLGRVRSSENTLALNDPDISRIHAMIVASPEGHRLVDAQSTNGTTVNGKPVTAEVLLRTGDRILVGSTVLLYTRA